MTKVLRISLLGVPKLSKNGRFPATFKSAKAQALLYYLAVNARFHARSALAALLWGEMPEADGLRNLRGVLMQLRAHFPAHFEINDQQVGWQPAADVWLDTAQFQETLEGEFDVESWKMAVSFYRAPFLNEFSVRNAPAFDDWITMRQEMYHKLMRQGCSRLSRHYGDNGQYEMGIVYAQRVVALSPLREDGHRQLMRLLASSGQRNAALSQYQRCVEILADELAIAPTAETTALLEQIRQGTHDQKRQLIPTTPLEEKRPLAIQPAFIAGPPILYPLHFFGRNRELKRLFNLFKQFPLQNGAIIGPRRSGKTSLLHYLKNITTAPAAHLRPEQRQDWLPQPERYRWVFVDFQDRRLGTPDVLLRYLLSQMGLSTPDSCDLEQFMDIVESELSYPTVILFDEIGVALTRCPELDDAFWESLRSLATNHTEGKLGFVLSSDRPPQELAQHSGFGSPFFNIFGYAATLGPLTEAETRELLAATPLPFSDEDVNWIMGESGRWPMLVQMLARERLLALEDNEPDSLWREAALAQIAPLKRDLMAV